MPKKELMAGSIVDSKCLKCKDVTSHAIVVMEGDTIGKVECKVCGARHAFRSPQARKSPAKKAAAKKTGAKKAKSSLVKDWESKVTGVDQNKVLPYGMDKTFHAGEIIDHRIFGLGLVQQVIRPDKMEVLFKDGLKLMRCRL